MAEKPIDQDYKGMLLDIAVRAIEAGMTGESAWPLAGIDLQTLPEELVVTRATFVTLHLRGELRGCIGSMEATRPLAHDVAYHAYAAAFQDPRFPSLTRAEWPETTVHLSILSPMQAVSVASEEELLALLRPGIDGVLLEEGRRHATFLPSVWEQVPDPAAFVRHLKQKGGWTLDEWPPQMRVFRYTTESVPA